MKKRHLVTLWLVLAALAPWLPGWLPVHADPPTESPLTLSYEIHATLDPVAHEVRAKGTLTWRNDSPVPVRDVCLHMYLNAFRDRRTTFMRESGGMHRGHRFGGEPGGIDLLSFVPEGGRDLRPEGAFQADDGNADDTTVLKIPLDVAIPPGASRTFELEWVSRLPRVFARTGYAGDFHMVAQWYPKPGVFEERIGESGEVEWAWNCHQFHGNSEFYADYGSYRVHITAPASYEGRIGASGERVAERRNEDGSITYTHAVDHVHDFAWVAGKDFEVHEATFEGGAGTSPDEQIRVAVALGRTPQELDLPPVKVYFLLQPEHRDQYERHRRAIWHALTYMGFWYGPYPYKTLTVVDPDHRGRDAGGMEYPTLITGGTRYIRPERRLSPEGVLVHEFGHQHFYGLVGTNEFESAWMDEGMTTYATAKVLMRAYPPQPSTTNYGALTTYSERPLPFTGIMAGAREAMAPLPEWVDEKLRIPFGNSTFIRERAADWFGVHHPPGDISLWAGFGDVAPIALLRELPPLTHLEPLPSTSSERERGWVASIPVTDPIAGRPAWTYMNRRSYGVNSYGRPSASLRTLEGLVGEDTMIRIMRTYAERYRFQHPKPADFYRTAAEVVADDEVLRADVVATLQELFERDADMDFGIHDIRKVELPEPEGPSAGATPDPKPLVESTVTVRRLGNLRIPMDIRVVFDDGSVRTYRWERDDTVSAVDGGSPPKVVTPPRGQQSRWVKLRYLSRNPPKAAAVDPLGRYALDRDRTNDGIRLGDHAKPSWAVALRTLIWVQRHTTFYGGI